MGQTDGSNARMWVRLKDGRTLTSHVGIVPGDYGNRVLRQEVVKKFRFLTADVLGARRAGDVVQAVERLQDLRGIRELTALLGGPGWT